VPPAGVVTVAAAKQAAQLFAAGEHLYINCDVSRLFIEVVEAENHRIPEDIDHRENMTATRGSRVLRTIEEWLVDLGGIAAKVEIDGRSYALEPPIPVGE
jgi:hypothetical protein